MFLWKARGSMGRTYMSQSGASENLGRGGDGGNWGSQRGLLGGGGIFPGARRMGRVSTICIGRQRDTSAEATTLGEVLEAGNYRVWVGVWVSGIAKEVIRVVGRLFPAKGWRPLNDRPRRCPESPDSVKVTWRGRLRAGTSTLGRNVCPHYAIRTQ